MEEIPISPSAVLPVDRLLQMCAVQAHSWELLIRVLQSSRYDCYSNGNTTKLVVWTVVNTVETFPLNQICFTLFATQRTYLSHKCLVLTVWGWYVAYDLILHPYNTTHAESCTQTRRNCGHANFQVSKNTHEKLGFEQGAYVSRKWLVLTVLRR